MALSAYSPTLLKKSNPSLNNNLNEIVFIKKNAADYQSLVSQAAPGVEVVLLDCRSDGLTQIADYLADRQNIDSIYWYEPTFIDISCPS